MYNNSDREGRFQCIILRINVWVSFKRGFKIQSLFLIIACKLNWSHLERRFRFTVGQMRGSNKHCKVNDHWVCLSYPIELETLRSNGYLSRLYGNIH